mmetsp:Transcript_9447/g.19442  ORF Transcript_9447/g.19442 Transcript_9447/m.19442 type:complete len:278 (+) Transcript_9447:762-1595(+)
MSVIIFCAASMSLARLMAVASCASILRPSSSILLCLSISDWSVFESSWSHQFLWSSSSFCSCWSRKIIFWMALMTWSKGPSFFAASSAASCSMAPEWATRASLRNRSRACWNFGTDNCNKAAVASTGDGGGTGFEGASVRTPVTFAKISTAASMALISLARVSERSVHSIFLTSQDFFVSESVFSSASRSSCALLRSDSAWFFFASVSPWIVFFSVLEASLASRSCLRACSESWKAFKEFVSSVSIFVSSSSNLSLNSFNNSITLWDLKLYLFTWPV